jgi:hypothetical protein
MHVMKLISPISALLLATHSDATCVEHNSPDRSGIMACQTGVYITLDSMLTCYTSLAMILCSDWKSLHTYPVYNARSLGHRALLIDYFACVDHACNDADLSRICPVLACSQPPVWTITLLIDPAS